MGEIKRSNFFEHMPRGEKEPRGRDTFESRFEFKPEVEIRDEDWEEMNEYYKVLKAIGGENVERLKLQAEFLDPERAAKFSDEDLPSREEALRIYEEPKRRSSLHYFLTFANDMFPLASEEEKEMSEGKTREEYWKEKKDDLDGFLDASRGGLRDWWNAFPVAIELKYRYPEKVDEITEAIDAALGAQDNELSWDLSKSGQFTHYGDARALACLKVLGSKKAAEILNGLTDAHFQELKAPLEKDRDDERWMSFTSHASYLKLLTDEGLPKQFQTAE